MRITMIRVLSLAFLVTLLAGLLLPQALAQPVKRGDFLAKEVGPPLEHGAKSHVHRVVFSPDGAQIATAGSIDKTVKIWEAATGKLLHTHTFKDNVYALEYSKDGSKLVAGGGPYDPKN